MIDSIREKLATGDFEMTLPHFIEEMAEDDLLFSDIETAIAKGKVSRRFSRDPRGPVTKWLVRPLMDG